MNLLTCVISILKKYIIISKPTLMKPHKTRYAILIILLPTRIKLYISF